MVTTVGQSQLLDPVSDVPRPKLGTLGVPTLTNWSGEVITFKTRKAFAILAYLLRAPGSMASRETLADAFWSGADRGRAVQSLRQALRQIRVAENEAAVKFLTTQTAYVSIDPTVFDWDLARINALVHSGEPRDFNVAEGLWHGDFLTGFNNIDREFDDWLVVERERIRSGLVSQVLKKIEEFGPSNSGAQVEAAAQFLLHLDRALEQAHRILIRLYLARGQKERALQQYQTCERELKTQLDAKPDAETLRLFSANASGQMPPAAGSSARKLNFSADPSMMSVDKMRRAYTVQTSPEAVNLPRISILSLELAQHKERRARVLRDEIAAGLSAHRSFELFQSQYKSEADAPELMRVDGGELGDYLLRYRHDEYSNNVYIQFEDRSNGQILFNEVADFDRCRTEGSVQDTAVQTVNRIHSLVLGRLRRPGVDVPFAKWCRALVLMWDFQPTSDELGLRLLRELEEVQSSFSLTYAGYASICMKRVLHYPSEGVVVDETAENALALAERAVGLDPWQAMNQRIYGWAQVLNGFPVQAARAFKEAERLNPYDAGNLMSVAEGTAYLGDTNTARKIANRAFDMSSSVPRVMYEYMANICFADGDYEAAIGHLTRAPAGSIVGLPTRVAALICSGREDEAKTLLRRTRESASLDELRKQTQNGRDLSVNMFQDPDTREKFRVGSDLVRKLVFPE